MRNYTNPANERCLSAFSNNSGNLSGGQAKQGISNAAPQVVRNATVYILHYLCDIAPRVVLCPCGYLILERKQKR